MKNFKLLLATTAILSTGAMTANAENPTADMNVDVELVMASQFRVAQNLEFGRWNIPNGTKTVTLSMASTGVVTPSSGVTELGSGTSRLGVTNGAPCNTLSFPDTVYLNPSKTYVKHDSGYGRLTGLTAVTDERNTWDADFPCKVFGNLTIDGMSEYDGEVASSKYKGKITITAVLGL